MEPTDTAKDAIVAQVVDDAVVIVEQEHAQAPTVEAAFNSLYDTQGGTVPLSPSGLVSSSSSSSSSTASSCERRT